jgi:hypothetical protein
MVAGTDSRVRAAVPIYGVGQNSYVFPWQIDADPVDPDTRLQRQTIEPEAYAPFVKCPLLFLDASNDHHGRLDLAMRTLDATTKAPMLREAYTPGYVHHIERSEGRDLPKWMDLHLKGVGPAWPAPPTIAISGVADDGSPRAAVTVDRPNDVERVVVHYGLNNPWPPSRFYRESVARPANAGSAQFIATTPTLTPQDTIYAYANVSYRDGITLSTRLTHAALRDLPGVKPGLHRSDVIDAMTAPAAWFWWRAGTDPWDETKLFVPWTGPDGEHGFTQGPTNVFSFATCALGDGQFHNDGDGPLLIDVWAATLPKNVDVELATHFFQPDYMPYKGHAKLGNPDGKWLTLRLVPGDFVNDKGIALKTWKNVDFFWLTGTPAPGRQTVFSNLRWESGTAQSHGVIQNAGFEAALDGWSLHVYGAKADAAADTSVKHEGWRSLLIASDQPSDAAVGQEIQLKPRQRYRFTGWVKTAKLQPADAKTWGTFQIQRPGGTGVIAAGENHGGDTDWTRVSIDFEAPADGRVRIAAFFAGFGKGTGTAWFDNLALEPIGVTPFESHRAR